MKKLIWICILIGSVCCLLSAQEAIVVDEEGNVGIGTGTPTARLEVNGEINALVSVKKRDGNTDEVMRNIMEALCPVGTILPFAGTAAPDGWLLCNGAEKSVDEFPELFAVIDKMFTVGNDPKKFNLPNLQGQFLRGASTGYPDRNPNGLGDINAPGSTQGDAFQEHQHLAYERYANGEEDAGDGSRAAANNVWTETYIWTQDILPGSRTASETRPRNIYVNYIIKY